MMETMKILMAGKEFEFRKSIPVAEFCGGVEAVVNTVVSDKDGYKPQIEELSIFMTVMHLYAIGWEKATMEEVWALLSDVGEADFWSANEAMRFIEACRYGIRHKKERHPLAAIADGLKATIVNIGKNDPDFLKNAVTLLKEVAGAVGGEQA